MADLETSRSNTKDILRDHARRLFAERGYEGVSMRDIAGSVGVQQSAIYNHFASKQHLLVDLMVDHMEDLIRSMRAAVDFRATPREQLESFVRFHVNYQLDNPDALFIAYMELRSLEPEGRETVVVLRDEYELALRGILDAGDAAGEFEVTNPAVVARCILAMMTGVTVWYKETGPLGREAVVDVFAETILRSVGCSSATAEC
ncbi:MAG: TetR/AcrR family transcriptional regulator [Paracoccaceae bacterium]|nr:TetR/AcrR family transcriptional regulator [Paracoccaceae bacterium]